MGKVKQTLARMSIRRSLITTLSATILLVGLLSAVTIFVASRVQQQVLLQRGFSVKVSDAQVNGGSVQVGLGEDSIQWHPLTAKQNVIYYGCYVAMLGLPVLYILAGAGAAAKIYYRAKLQQPLAQLEQGIRNIQDNNLDFTITCDSDDELGALCASMEKMRAALRQNNRELWEALEQRKLLNASVAHDLRTPITVLKGYLDYLDKSAAEGHWDAEKVAATSDAMRKATDRLEHYADCVRDVERLENVQVHLQEEDTAALTEDMESSACQLAGGKTLTFSSGELPPALCADRQLLLRVTDNLVQNAARYARGEISVELATDGPHLVICVKDDGKGFSPADLEQATTMFYSGEKSEEHFGIGLGICRLLCEKQGGSLAIGNRPGGGACVVAKVKL